MAVACVIGGAGRMGSWFAHFLKQNGYHTTIYDTDKNSATRLARREHITFVPYLKSAVNSAELVIMATPTKATPQVLEQVAGCVSPTTLIVEISSVKSTLRSALENFRRKGCQILSIHPMFGPGVTTLAGKVILAVMVPRRNATARRLLLLLRKEGVRVVHCSFTEHDRVASLVLTLPHFMNAMMLKTLKGMHADPNYAREVAGTSFKLQLLTSEAICQEDIDNQVSILMDTEDAVKSLERFGAESARTLRLIKRGARAAVTRALRDCRGYAMRDREFAGSYRRFNAAVEAANFDR